DFGALPPQTPPALRRLLRRMLEKDRKHRLDSAAAARLDIEEAISAPADTLGGRRRTAALAWSVASILFVAAMTAAGALYYVANTADEAQPIRFFVSPPDGWELARQSAPPGAPLATSLTISPDGRTLAFVARSMDSRFLIWLRPLEAVSARPLEGT